MEGKRKGFPWVTDLPVDGGSFMPVMRAARPRWRTGNETFNTLKNQGHRSGTGFGHGKRRLTTVPAMTVMPAFLTARTGAASRTVFAAAPGRGGS